MPHRRAVRRLLAAALLAVAGPAGSQARFDVVRVDDVMVPMRDGVRLHTEVYRPSRAGAPVDSAFPSLLLRTPYEIRGDEVVRQARAFAAAGYVVALQNIRGRYRSEGDFSKYSALDAPDGYDAIEWLARQAYSNGRVGTWGRSYAAHTQADAAKLAPPHLRAMIINQGGMADAWDHAVRHGGAFELGREITWAWQEARRETSDPEVRALLEREPVESWYDRLPLRRGQNPLSRAPEFETYLLDEWRNADRTAFWNRIALTWKPWYAKTADVPMLHLGGWYDIFLRGTLDNYLGLRAGKRGPVHVAIGPWVHGGNGRTWAGDVDFGPDSAIPGFEIAYHLRWFDRFLRDVPNGVDTEPPVRLFVMGGGSGTRDANGRLQHGGSWRSGADWPLPGTEFVKFFLREGGALSRTPPAMATSRTTYTFDPRRPVPTLGGSVSNRVKDGAYDQRERADFPASRPPYRPLRERKDVLVFETAPLEEDVVVVGPIAVVLHAATTGRDTDFAAKLIDVYPVSAANPDGFDLNLTDGILRASFRENRTKRTLLQPGEVYRLVVRPFATANVFRRGHRIRLDIASSNFPRFDLNPGTEEEPVNAARFISVDNTLYHERARASYLLLPIVSR